METLQRNANRGSISTDTGFNIENSCFFDSASSHNMYFNPASTSSTAERRKGTISFWVKRTKLGTVQRIFHFGENTDGYDSRLWLRFVAANTMHFYPIVTWTTTKTFEDVAAWYHIVVHYDTTQDEQDSDGSSDTNHAIDPDENPEGGSGTSQTKCWVNGIQMKDATGLLHGDTNGRTKNSVSGWGRDTLDKHAIGYDYLDTTGYFNGYLAEFHAVQGQVLEATDFGEFDEDTGIWKPIEVDLDNSDYGENGFYLKFDDSADMGADSSGEGNDFTLVNIDSGNQSTDTPTNNFCTLSPSWVYASAVTTGPTDGNLKVSGTQLNWAGSKSTMGVNKGKWYWEAKGSNVDVMLGIQTDGPGDIYGDHNNAHNILSTCVLYLAGEVYIKDSTSGRDDTDVTQTFDANDVYGIALNMDDNEISFYQDGSLITDGGDIDIDGLSDEVVFPFCSNYNTTIEMNFGGTNIFSISSGNADANGYGNFEHAPPSGYYSLCSKNLATYG